MILLFLLPALADVLRGCKEGIRCPNGGCGCIPDNAPEPTSPPPQWPTLARPVMHDFYTYPPPILSGNAPVPPLLPLPKLPNMTPDMLPKLGPQPPAVPKPPPRTPAPLPTPAPLVVNIGDVLEGQDEFSKWRKVKITKVNGTGWETDVSSNGKDFDFHWGHVHHEFLRSTRAPRTSKPTTTTTTTMTPYTTTTMMTTTAAEETTTTTPVPIHVPGKGEGQWVRKLLPPCNVTDANATATVAANGTSTTLCNCTQLANGTMQVHSIQQDNNATSTQANDAPEQAPAVTSFLARFLT